MLGLGCSVLRSELNDLKALTNRLQTEIFNYFKGAIVILPQEFVKQPICWEK